MADVTISDLPAGTPTGVGVVPYSDGISTSRVSINQINSLVSGVPVGSVFHLATSNLPAGYLQCNGDTVPNGTGTVQGVTANFSALYTVLGSTYGALGKLPDLRGQFIRGWNNTSTVDPSRVMGSTQTAYAGYNTFRVVQDDGDAATGAYKSLTNVIINSTNLGWGQSLGPTNVATIPGDTRPTNVALMPVIKY